MNVQKEEKVENSLEVPMRGEEGAIVEDNNEEEEVSSI